MEPSSRAERVFLAMPFGNSSAGQYSSSVVGSSSALLALELLLPELPFEQEAKEKSIDKDKAKGMTKLKEAKEKRHEEKKGKTFKFFLSLIKKTSVRFFTRFFFGGGGV